MSTVLDHPKPQLATRTVVIAARLARIAEESLEIGDRDSAAMYAADAERRYRRLVASAVASGSCEAKWQAEDGVRRTAGIRDRARRR